MEYSKNMERNRYYTPRIGELFIGYECFIMSSWGLQPGTWPSILGEDTHVHLHGNNTVEEQTKHADLSTLFLTKEQIEADGGIFIGGYTPMLSRRSEYELGEHHRLEYCEETKKGIIYKKDENGEFTAHGVKYSGFIPSINELRYISKLLGIK